MTSRDVTPVDGRHARVSTTMETTDKGEDKEDEGGRPRKPINKVMMVAKEDEDGDKNNEDDEGEENRERERERIKNEEKLE